MTVIIVKRKLAFRPTRFSIYYKSVFGVGQRWSDDSLERCRVYDSEDINRYKRYRRESCRGKASFRTEKKTKIIVYLFIGWMYYCIPPTRPYASTTGG